MLSNEGNLRLMCDSSFLRFRDTRIPDDIQGSRGFNVLLKFLMVNGK